MESHRHFNPQYEGYMYEKVVVKDMGKTRQGEGGFCYTRAEENEDFI